MLLRDENFLKFLIEKKHTKERVKASIDEYQSKYTKAKGQKNSQFFYNTSWQEKKIANAGAH